MDASQLMKIGLGKNEAEIYLALLSLGKSTVTSLTQHTGIHRTYIYDILEKLKEKGLVAYSVEKNKKYFIAAEPKKLKEYLLEKVEAVEVILPELNKIKNLPKEETLVESYKGLEGMKSLLNDVLKEKKDVVGFGIDEEIFQTQFPVIIENYYKKAEKAGYSERYLTHEKAKYIYKKKHVSYRFIPVEYFGHIPTLIYGDKIWITIFDPMTNILIKNRQLADTYRKHFEMLWKIAKEIPVKKPKNI